jgi:hypothetical protein
MEGSSIKKAFLIVFIGLLIPAISGEKSWSLSTYEQSLIESAKQAFSKETISSDTLRHPVSATPLFMEIMLNRERMSSEAKKILSPFTDRPDYSPHTEYTYNSPSGHFKIHYTTTGDAAVYRPDVDENQDGIPDYVNQCGLILDHVWSKEIDSLGYDSPPSDADYPSGMDNGGDGRYDVYLDFLSPDFFGASFPEYQIEPQIPVYTSYLLLRNDYSYWVEEYPLYKNVYEPLSVTAAHEFFHAIHFGYDATEAEVGPDTTNYKPYWMEISAVWMEDMVYDNINDYLGYLPHFYREPWLSLRTFRSILDYHPYASCVWAFFLQEKYGRDVIKKIWEKCAEVPGDNALHATDEVLQESPYNSSLEEAFREFTVWNYFIGDRAIPEVFYSEGDLFVDYNDNPLEMTVERIHTQYPVTSTSPQFTHRPEDLGSNYLVFEPYTDSTGGLSIDFVGLDTDDWNASVAAYAEGFFPLTFEMGLNELQTGNAEVYNWNDYSEIIFIPSVASKEGEVLSYDYDYSADYDTSLYGPQLFPPWLTVDPRGPKTAYTGKVLRFDVIATDQNSEDILTITKDGVGNFNFTPSISPASGDFSWTPGRGDVLNSPFLVVFSVSDGVGGYDTTIVEIEVLERSDKDIFPQNFPNPFVIEEHSFTYFPIVLSEESDVEISITTVAGEEIKNLKKRLGVGTHNYDSKHLLPKWDGKNEKGEYVTSGVYLYHVKTKNSSVLKKMVVIR